MVYALAWLACSSLYYTHVAPNCDPPILLLRSFGLPCLIAIICLIKGLFFGNIFYHSCPHFMNFIGISDLNFYIEKSPNKDSVKKGLCNFWSTILRTYTVDPLGRGNFICAFQYSAIFAWGNCGLIHRDDGAQLFAINTQNVCDFFDLLLQHGRCKSF